MISTIMRELMLMSQQRNLFRPVFAWAHRMSSSTSADATDSVPEKQEKKHDKLYKRIDLEMRAHNPDLLRSYITFVKNVCNLLEIEKSPYVRSFPYKRWLVWVCKSKFAKKKYKLHYETRTHIRQFHVNYLTGSTASTFLEYIERNIPEGLALKVTYTEMCPLPETITDQGETTTNSNQS